MAPQHPAKIGGSVADESEVCRQDGSSDNVSTEERSGKCGLIAREMSITTPGNSVKSAHEHGEPILQHK